MAMFSSRAKKLGGLARPTGSVFTMTPETRHNATMDGKCIHAGPLDVCDRDDCIRNAMLAKTHSQGT